MRFNGQSKRQGTMRSIKYLKTLPVCGAVDVDKTQAASCEWVIWLE